MDVCNTLTVIDQSRQERLCKRIKRSKTPYRRGLAPGPYYGELIQRSQRLPSWWGEQHLPKNSTPIDFSSLAVRPFRPGHLRGPPQCYRPTGAYTVVSLAAFIHLFRKSTLDGQLVQIYFTRRMLFLRQPTDSVKASKETMS